MQNNVLHAHLVIIIYRIGQFISRTFLQITLKIENVLLYCNIVHFALLKNL